MCDNEGNTEISRKEMASGAAFVVTSVFQAALRKEIYLWQPVSIDA